LNAKNGTRRRFPAGAALVLAILFCTSPLYAKDFKAMPAVETGGRWMFGYQNGVNEVRTQPALAYGLTFTQIVDFSWSRNIAFDASYLHSRSHGEMTWLSTGNNVVFNLTADSFSGNIGYFFTGRKLLPYISGGLGVAALKYEPESAQDTIWEQDPFINLGGGLDYTLWEAEVSRALDRILLGARFRYEYIFVQKIFDTALTDLAITARLELRF
jgi:hypothetical protein